MISTPQKYREKKERVNMDVPGIAMHVSNEMRGSGAGTIARNIGQEVKSD